MIDITAGKFQAVFTQEQEFELVTYLKTMESRLFGLTLNDLRALAYQLAERNDIAHRYQTEIAGKFWVDGFFKEKSYSVDS